MEAQVGGTGLSIAPATGAITGYLKILDACKLLESSEENGRLKKL